MEAALARLDKRARDFVDSLTALVGEEPAFLRDGLQDSFRVFDCPVKYFVVQLDPDSEVLVVFDHSCQQEFGDWNSDRYADALRAVQEDTIVHDESRGAIFLQPGCCGPAHARPARANQLRLSRASHGGPERWSG